MNDLFEQSVDFTSRLPQLVERLGVQLVEWTATSGLQILLILVMAMAAMAALRRAIHYLHGRFTGKRTSPDLVKRADTLTGVLRAVAGIFVYLAAAMMVLQEVGIDIAPILATAGVGGLAIGFGAQSLVKDVISGFFLLFEDQIRVGDVAEVAGRGGVVERIGLRTIVLRDLSGAVHTIPNGNVDVIMNMTKDYSRYVFDVGVAYREDTDEVAAVLSGIMDVMREEEPWKADILEPLEILGVNSFDDSAVVVRARIKTRPGAQWGIAREFNRRMKKRFDELGIEIPFPHVTLWAGEPKKGSPPPLRLAVDGTIGEESPRARATT